MLANFISNYNLSPFTPYRSLAYAVWQTLLYLFFPVFGLLGFIAGVAAICFAPFLIFVPPSWLSGPTASEPQERQTPRSRLDNIGGCFIYGCGAAIIGIGAVVLTPIAWFLSIPSRLITTAVKGFSDNTDKEQLKHEMLEIIDGLKGTATLKNMQNAGRNLHYKCCNISADSPGGIFTAEEKKQETQLFNAAFIGPEKKLESEKNKLAANQYFAFLSDTLRH